MKLAHLCALTSTVLLSVIASRAEGSGLLDQQVSFSIRFPTIDDVYAGPLSFVSKAGSDANIIAGNISFSIDVEDSTVIFRFNDGSCCTSAATFGGPVATFNSATFPGLGPVFLQSTNIAGFDSSRLTFDSSSIYINIAGGLDLTNNREVVLSVSSVPEPTSYVLLIGGVSLLGFRATRKRFLG